MPELPEVETVRRELEPWLTGRRIVTARRAEAPAGPKYVNLERADGQTIARVDRLGKFLVMPLVGPDGSTDGDELIVHLGMTGLITSAAPRDHVRIVMQLDGAVRSTLYFRDVRRFGRFLVAPRGDRSMLPTLHRIGPEPLGPDFTVEVLTAGLSRSRSAVKTVLLAQRVVAGLGNIYVDEALWRTQIHPLTPASAVPRRQHEALQLAIVEILSAAVAGRGTTLRDYRTVSGEEGGYASELDAYGRDGEPCRRCETSLERIVVGQRSTHFCPTCQRRVRPRRTKRR